MPERNLAGEIKAAGGVILRRCGDKIEVLLVHRPAFDDWTLPKGKVKRQEDDIAAALREVAEETNMNCAIVAALGDMHYFDRNRRAKVTRYWAMVVIKGEFRPSREVDACMWFGIDAAAVKATRSGERSFLRLLSQRLNLQDVDRIVSIDEPVVVYEEPL
jgi:8-oxo-dGTP diphosphatase